MSTKEMAEKRPENASTAQSKADKTYYEQSSLINQGQIKVEPGDCIAQAREAMIAAGLPPPDEIIFNGKIQRYTVAGDKRGSQNGWYVFYSDGVPSGAFGSWKTGIKSKWCSKSLILMTSEEKVEYRKRMEDACLQRQQLKAQEQAQAAKHAKDILGRATPANPNHEYLVKKRISPLITLQIENLLVLTMVDIEGVICSLQFIDPDGRKRFLKGGRKKGCFVLVQGVMSNSEIFIVEGFATAATIARIYPEACVIAALDAGNLESVATAVRQRWPEAKIIIYADDDRQTDGNPGMTNAREAAILINALVAVPNWPEGAPIELTDFNDLANWINGGVK